MGANFISHERQRNVDTQDQEVDLTPMLDVIFIMLIFFIVTASFAKESGLALNKPEPSNDQSTQKSIVLQVLEAGHITIQGQPVDVRAIKPTITRLIAENPEAEVAVRLHKRAKTHNIVKAIDALHAAKVIHPPISLIKT